ncbi:hypothetical protein [Nostoc sp. PA-18-2419]|uniref:hypothetical protein n=1 Tax=Nostoc sp. PA-18-2419 TaxID=2575443 RepID=UPI0011093B22|nr:hypothetical protein [Nostoc sp. PA-18-2419]
MTIVLENRLSSGESSFQNKIQYKGDGKIRLNDGYKCHLPMTRIFIEIEMRSLVNPLDLAQIA